MQSHRGMVLSALSLGVSVFLAGNAEAGLKLGKDFKKVLPRKAVPVIEKTIPKVIPMIIPGPLGTGVGAAVGGAKPGEIVPRVLVPAPPPHMGGVPGAVQGVVRDQAIREAADRLGPNAAALVHVLQFPERYQGEASLQGVRSLMSAVAHGDLSHLLAAPLAQALNDAIAFYEPRSQPLPPLVRRVLSEVYEDNTLDAARWVIDRRITSLPGLINRIHHHHNTVHAVTVGHIIVFSTDPGPDWYLWGHEMMHSVQYETLRVEGFAAEYTKHWRAMENEAIAAGVEVKENSPFQ